MATLIDTDVDKQTVLQNLRLIRERLESDAVEDEAVRLGGQTLKDYIRCRLDNSLAIKTMEISVLSNYNQEMAPHSAALKTATNELKQIIDDLNKTKEIIDKIGKVLSVLARVVSFLV